MQTTLRLLAAPLVTIALLINTLGCSKKQDPTPATAFGTGSYKLDGISRNCRVQAVAVTTASSSSAAYDNLKILLTTENSPSQEYLLLEFNKLPSQPNAAYTLAMMAYFPTGGGYGTLYDNEVTTLTATSDGSFSGTFSGKTTTTTTSGATVTHTIAAGTFTGAHP